MYQPHTLVPERRKPERERGGEGGRGARAASRAGRKGRMEESDGKTFYCSVGSRMGIEPSPLMFSSPVPVFLWDPENGP